MPSEEPQMQEDQQASDSFAPEQPLQPPEMPETVEEADVSGLDVELKLTSEQEKEIVKYLDENLPRMKCSTEEEDMINTCFAMYEMSARSRNFPYENAPSIASSDAHDKLNDWLDQAETAFLQQKVTFVIDREDASYKEADAGRIERTVHKKFFQGSGFSRELRTILFEAGYLGGSIVSTREQYDLQPSRKKVIIKTIADLEAEQKNLTQKQINQAKEDITAGKMFFAERDVLEAKNVGPVVTRINRTKFFLPRNQNDWKKWQIVAEQEFYTKSKLLEMAQMGELDMAKVNKCIEARRKDYADKTAHEKSGLGEDVKPHILDSSWARDLSLIQEMGDSYDDEFAVYRTTMLYGVPTEVDKSGKMRTWIEVLYCPAGDCIIGAKFCQDGFPYKLIQIRPVPYRAIGPGIAQQRFNANMLTSDLLSYFLAALEQEIGAPLMIRKNSSLWATAFRAYPSSVVYTEDPEKDAKFIPFPEKSRLAVEGIKVILGSSPDANQGAGYASGKRQELLDNQKMIEVKAKLLSVAIDCDEVFNACWRILCRISKYNTPENAYIPWIVQQKPKDKKLYVLAEEMDEHVEWSCTVAALTLSPDARLQRALMQKEIMHDKVPVSVNSPRLTQSWLNFIANHFDNMDESARAELLPNEEDFQMMQAQQAAAGAAAQPPEGGGKPPQNGNGQKVPPLVAQSRATPHRNPAARQ